MENVCWRRPLVALAMLVVFAAGCGDDEPVETLECGEGTMLHGGECIVQTHDCDDDQIVTPLGDCEAPDVFCGDGAVYDEGDEKCLSTADVRCGEDTVEQGGECVIADGVRCGEGTVLADAECVLVDEVCGQGTELDAPHCHPAAGACEGPAQWDVEVGECVRLDEIECGEHTVESDDACVPVHTFADELAADADIDHADGAPIVPDEEQPFVFTGTVEGPLTHTFELEGTAGQWLEITVYSRGLPSPGMSVGVPIGTWQRTVSAGIESRPSRTVAIPDTGAFDLRVFTSLSDGEFPEVLGDESWKYVGTVEVIDPPEVSSWDYEADVLSGAFDETSDNMVSVDAEDTDLLLLTPHQLGPDVRTPTAEVWTTPQTYSERRQLTVGDAVELDTSDADTVYLHFDAVEFVGPRTGYEVTARSTERLPADGVHTHEVDAEAGEVLFLSHRSDSASTVDVEVFLNEELAYARQEVLADNRSSYSVSDTRREFFYVPETGTYRIEFTNTTGDELTNFVSTSSSEEVPVFSLPAGETDDFKADVEAEGLTAGDWRLVVVDASETSFYDVTITAGDGNPRGAVYDADRREITSTRGSLGVVEMEFAAGAPGPYFVISRPWSSSSSSATYDGLRFEISGEPVEALPPGQTTTETISVDTFDILHGAVSFRVGESADVRLLNPQQTPIMEAQSISDTVELMELMPGPGDFVVEVENTGEDPILGLDIDVVASAPLEIIDADDHFQRNYQRPNLEAGQREFVVIHPDDETMLDMRAEFDDEEEATLRVHDINTGDVIDDVTGEKDIELRSELLAQRPYLIEFEAQTALENGYEWDIDGTEIRFVEQIRVHEPTLDIETDGGQATSVLSVDQCPEIVDISISMVMPSGSGSNVDIHLYPPSMEGGFLTLRESNFGTLTTTYPDDTEPEEPLDVLFGESGNDVWSIDIFNHSSITDAELESWGVHMICAK